MTATIFRLPIIAWTLCFLALLSIGSAPAFAGADVSVDFTGTADTALTTDLKWKDPRADSSDKYLFDGSGNAKIANTSEGRYVYYEDGHAVGESSTFVANIQFTFEEIESHKEDNALIELGISDKAKGALAGPGDDQGFLDYFNVALNANKRNKYAIAVNAFSDSGVSDEIGKTDTSMGLGANQTLDTSDKLELRLSVTKGESEDDWTCVGALYNVTVDPATPVLEVTLSDVSSAAASGFFGDSTNLVAYMHTASSFSGSNIDNLLIDSFEFTSPNAAPSFGTNDSVFLPEATQDVLYTGSIASLVSDVEGDTITFSKVSGPTWLTIATDGSLSGTPTSSDVGVSTFRVSASDAGGSAEAYISIDVPAEVIDFTTAEGWIDGDLTENSYLWTGSDPGVFTLDGSGTGTVMVNSTINDNLTYTLPLIADAGSYSVSTTFNFDETAAVTSSTNFHGLQLSSGSSLFRLQFRRSNGTGDFRIDLKTPEETEDGGAVGRNGTSFNESLLGLEAGDTEASPNLKLTLSISEEAGDNEWLVIANLFNLDTDTSIYSETITVTIFDGTFGSEPVFAQIRSEKVSDPGVSMTDFNIDTFSFSPASVAPEAAAITTVATYLSDDTDANWMVNTPDLIRFTVEATGYPVPTYQWKKGDADLYELDENGAQLLDDELNPILATGASFEIDKTIAGDQGLYKVVVTNNTGGADNVVTSTPTFLTVDPLAPTITDQPDDLTVSVPNSATFTVVVTDGNPTPTTYQWQKGGVDIEGETGSSLTINPTSESDAGDYRVVVGNGVTTDIISEVATLTLGAGGSAPVIDTQPVGVTVTAPASATLTVVASGTPAPTYQWKDGNGDDIVGATSSSLTFDPSEVADTGNYSVVVSNSEGSVSSNTATLTVNPIATVVTLSDLAHVYDGGSKSATVSTDQGDIAVAVTYDGSSTPPTEAGSYAVVATVTESNYSGSKSGTLVISKAAASVTLSDLSQDYDGTAKSATVTTNPSSLTVAVTYDGSSDVPSAVGSYAVMATVVDSNYTGSASGTLVIGKATATVTFSDLSYDFDGTAKSVTVVTNPPGLSVDVTYDASSDAPSAVGNYAVVATVVDGNYSGNASDTLVISKGTATVTLSDLSYEFDGGAKSATVVTDPPGLTVDVTYDGSSDAPSTAGSYAVVATISDSNYSGSASDTLVINKATATVTLSDLVYEFDGGAKSVTVTTNPPDLTLDVTYDGSSDAPSTQGSYVVVATVNDLNYEGTSEDTLLITAPGETPVTITVSGLAQTYDGTPKAVGITTDPADGPTVSVTYDGSSDAPINAGSYTVEANVDENDDGYVGAATKTLIISKATATVTFSDLAQEFDGTAKSVTVVTDPPGLAVDVSYDGASDAPSAVGSYAVVATVDDSNYSGSSSDTLVIGKAVATVTLSELAFDYDGSAKSVSVVTDPPGLAVDVSYDGASDAPSAVGSYAVVATVDDSNYSGSSSDTLVINKGTATVTLSDLFQDFDGAAKSVTVVTDPPDLVVDLTYDGASEAPSAVGSYAVVATVNDDSYSGTANGTLNVNLPLAITEQPQSQTVFSSGKVVFTVVATGTPAPTYQWKKDGVDLVGETGMSLTIDSVAKADEGDYSVVVSNTTSAVNTLESDIAVLSLSANEPNDYEAWAIAAGLSADEMGMDADPDLDGDNNLFEYATGGNPAGGVDPVSTRPGMEIESINGVVYLKYTFARRSNTPELNYELETSQTLVGDAWSGGQVAVPAGNAEAGFQKMSISIPLGVNPEFVRLVVTYTEPQ
ncbi:MBG domain-containing protein [Pelagicoccus mobilis]|uniref:Immunoglobulin domain-containing protein n=1 Tax=Pelagicoccus mobilis TaxID=415221 RepID=A0A934VQH9_9BACT|nr:MBG domain-containing protein [Pelagicoccus mobilis]MBK1876514.1 immunoglobulin domain-containing protein [Pelagicoccus mobilis]